MATTAAFAAILILSTVVSLVLWRRAELAKAVAIKSAEESRQQRNALFASIDRMLFEWPKIRTEAELRQAIDQEGKSLIEVFKEALRNEGPGGPGLPADPRDLERMGDPHMRLGASELEDAQRQYFETIRRADANERPPNPADYLRRAEQAEKLLHDE